MARAATGNQNQALRALKTEISQVNTERKVEQESLLVRIKNLEEENRTHLQDKDDLAETLRELKTGYSALQVEKSTF